MQFESPDLRYTHNYTTDRLPQTFHLSLLKPAKRFLRLIRERSAFEFLRTKAEFETSDDDRWMPLLHLGEGGWGEVGCWAKKDEEGTIIDRVAIKQVREPADRKERERLNSLRWDDTDVYAALLEEAVIQRQLNRSLSESKSARGFVHSTIALLTKTNQISFISEATSFSVRSHL